MKCPDCRGNGKYVGARVVEDCRLCKGLGELKEDGTHLDIANLPEWMRDHVNEKDLAAPLKVGSIIYVYDCDWYKTRIIHFGIDSQGREILRADHIYGRFFILKSKLTFNVTQQRWEFICSGTPVWP